MSQVKINDVRMEGEEMIFDPYNPQNREITETEVRGILCRFGVPNMVPIHNMELYKRAFVHKSYVKRPELENKERGIIIAHKPSDCLPLKTKSNDRLEFVGDGVLECITKMYLYERFPKSDEGFMTDTKIALVKNDAIGQLALDIGLQKWYIISKNAEQKNTRTNVKKLGNLFEAFVGALFLDCNKIALDDEQGWFSKGVFLSGPGFQMAQLFLVSIFETPGLVPWHKIIEVNENYKNQLQVIIQKEFKTVPHYLELQTADEHGGTGACADYYYMGVYLCIGQPIHSVKLQDAMELSEFESWRKMHDWMAHHGGRIFVKMGEGKNKIKKKAEQSACKTTLERLQNMG
jgi:dsRNA-specific ribonuclease